MKGIIQLFKEAWKIYRLKIKTLLGIIGIPVGFLFFFQVLIYFLSSTSLKYSIWFSILMAVFYLGSFFLWLWAVSSLLYNLKENTGIKESYRKGFKILGFYIWVYLLLNIIIAGGFLLFLIPGVLFTIWFSLALFVLIFEEKKGFEALFRSKQLIKGNFWGVLARFLILNLITGIGLFLIFALIFLGTGNKQIIEGASGLLSYLLQLFIIPFFIIYAFLIYDNLREIKSEISYRKPAKIEKLKYVLPGILGITIIGLIIFVLFLNVFLGRDDPPLDDSDLRISKIEIPEEENAFYDLAPYKNTRLNEELKEIIVEDYWPEGKEKIKEEKEIYWPSEKLELIEGILEREAWDESFVEELLERNKEVFDDFEKALKRPHYQDPIYRDPAEINVLTPITSLGVFRDIARLNIIKSYYLLDQGKEKEALDQVIKVIKFGELLNNSPRPDHLILMSGFSIKEEGLQALREIIPSLNLSSEVLESYIDELEQFKRNKEMMIRLVKMDYMISINTKSDFIDVQYVDSSKKSDVSGFEITSSWDENLLSQLSYIYKPNRTQEMFAEHYRFYIDKIKRDDCSEKSSPNIEFSFPNSKIQMLFTENIIGKELCGIMLATFSTNLRCFDDFSIMGTQNLMAMKAYKTDNGKLPPSLENLVPEYLSKIPTDPFSGDPMKYSAEKKIIYSTGKEFEELGRSGTFEIKF